VIHPHSKQLYPVSTGQLLPCAANLSIYWLQGLVFIGMFQSLWTDGLSSDRTFRKNLCLLPSTIRVALLWPHYSSDLLWSVGKFCLWYASVTAENTIKWWLLSAFCWLISVVIADSVWQYICQDLWGLNLYFVYSDQTCRTCLSSAQYSSVCQKYGNICNNIEMYVIKCIIILLH
jgi:hypothetical protein